MFVFCFETTNHKNGGIRMAGFDYNHFSADFASRTAKNLNLVYRVANFQRNQKNGSEQYMLNTESLPNSLKRLISIATDKKCEGFEVTQLLLSIYGMLLVPYEKYKHDPNLTKAKILRELRQTSEYKKLNEKIGELRTDNRYRNTYQSEDQDLVYSFIYHLRNSLAHEGIHFLPLESGQTEKIEELLLYDFDAYDQNGKKLYNGLRDAKERFCVRLKIVELKEIVIKISEMYSKIQEDFDAGDMDR